MSKGRRDFYAGLSFSVLVTLQEGQRARFACHWPLWLFHTKRRQNLLPNQTVEFASEVTQAIDSLGDKSDGGGAELEWEVITLKKIYFFIL